MNLFEKMNEELLQEELLNEIQFDFLVKILNTDAIRDRQYNSIKNGAKRGEDESAVEDSNRNTMSREQVDQELNKIGFYKTTRASVINAKINAILDYYCPA